MLMVGTGADSFLIMEIRSGFELLKYINTRVSGTVGSHGKIVFRAGGA